MSSDDDDRPLGVLLAAHASAARGDERAHASAERDKKAHASAERGAERPHTSAIESAAVNRGTKRGRHGSVSAAVEKRGRYTLDGLTSGSRRAAEQYDLGSARSSGSSSSDSGDNVATSASGSSSGSSFNYLAFDAARERDLDRQQGARGLGIASTLRAAPGYNPSSLELPAAVDLYLRFLAAGLLLPDGGASVLRDQPGSPDAQLYEAARSRIEVCVRGME
jgi:hypothetical protein